LHRGKRRENNGSEAVEERGLKKDRKGLLPHYSFRSGRELEANTRRIGEALGGFSGCVVPRSITQREGTVSGSGKYDQLPALRKFD
jgi:hypothetical protein